MDPADPVRSNDRAAEGVSELQSSFHLFGFVVELDDCLDGALLGAEWLIEHTPIQSKVAGAPPVGEARSGTVG